MKTVKISGMDRSHERYSYEWCCQVILFRALKWLRERPEGSEYPRIISFRNITGITIPENKAAKDLEKFALDHPKLREFGATGAMVQFSIGHAMKRSELGDIYYFGQFKDEPDRVFDFDELEAFPELEANHAHPS
jgi:hypothetical protein